MQKFLAAPEHIYDSPDSDDRRKLTEIYLASDVDARIAELEKALQQISDCYLCCGTITAGCQGQKVHEIVSKALMESVTK